MQAYPSCYSVIILRLKLQYNVPLLKKKLTKHILVFNAKQWDSAKRLWYKLLRPHHPKLFGISLDKRETSPPWKMI